MNSFIFIKWADFPSLKTPKLLAYKYI